MWKKEAKCFLKISRYLLRLFHKPFYTSNMNNNQGRGSDSKKSNPDEDALKANTPYFPNIQECFTHAEDDSAQLKDLKDNNSFIINEIEKMKLALEKKDKEISNIAKQIKDFK